MAIKNVLSFPTTHQAKSEQLEIPKGFRVIKKDRSYRPFVAQYRVLGCLWWDPLPWFEVSHETLEDAIDACVSQARFWKKEVKAKPEVVWESGKGRNP